MALVISTYRKMGLRELPTIPDFGRLTSGLGQALFDPPNVAGWAGGRTWITPSTLLQRGNLFRSVLFPDVKGFRPPDRSIAAGDIAVGERVARGMDITEATKDPGMAAEMVSETNAMVIATRTTTQYGGFQGRPDGAERT